MNCCVPTILPFINTPSSSVGYGDALKEKYGQRPQVQVVYFIDGEYLISHDYSQVKFDGSTINVDHGGPASGFISIR